MKQTIMRLSTAALCLLLLLGLVGCKDRREPTPSGPDSSIVSDDPKDPSSAPASDDSSSEPSSEEPSPEGPSSDTDGSSKIDTPVIPIPQPADDDEDEDEDEVDDKREPADNEKPSAVFTSTKFGKYRYVWGDEFTASHLDGSKWNVLVHSDENYSAKAFEEGDPELSKVFEIKDGAVNTKYIHYYDPTNSLVEYAGAAQLTTKNTMSYRYGYLEVRSRMDFNKMASAIWLVNDGALNSPESPYCGLEIDVFETLASLDSVTPNIHRWYRDGRHTNINAIQKPKSFTFFDTTNLSNEYHLYGFEWTPTEISMYVDDVKYWTLDTTKSFDDDNDTGCYDLPMYLMISGASAFTSGSTWFPYTGAILSNESLPLTQSIDWVRLYQDPAVTGSQLNVRK